MSSERLTTEQMLEKSAPSGNRTHVSPMTCARQLPRQLQWDGLNLNTDYKAFSPRPLSVWEFNTSVDRQATRVSEQM